MANFRTHIQFAALGSSIFSSLLLAAEVLNPRDALLCALAGTLGGILPDVDSDNSHSLSIVFAILAMATSVACVIMLIDQWPLLWVWAACLLAFLFLQFIVRPLFAAFTVHRGVFHSLLACFLFVSMVAAAASFLGASAVSSWFFALFTGFGFCLHLLLDEIYSVDFMNVKIKRSFGSALKVWHYGDGTASLLMFCLACIFFILAPPFGEYLHVLGQRDLFDRLEKGLSLKQQFH